MMCIASYYSLYLHGNLTYMMKYTMLVYMGLLDYLKRRSDKKRGKERFILCLDGGGMRGIIPATLLMHIEKTLHTISDDRPLYSHFDLIAGTSTGGLIALALSSPFKNELFNHVDKSMSMVSNIAQIYREYGQTIFPKGNSIFPTQVINQLFSHKYDDASFNHLLYNLFGNTTLQEALTPTMVVSYNYTHDKPYIFSNTLTPHALVRLAARATSAAPTYFPPAFYFDEISKENIPLIDGGVVANNPVLYAYKEAKRLYPEAEKFHIISLGTGKSSQRIEIDKSNGGVLSWFDPVRGTPLHQIYASCQMNTSDEIAHILDDVTYLRIHKDIGKKIKLDETDPKILTHMSDFADDLFNEYKEEITSYLSLCSQIKIKPNRP
ncbi:MAG: hypothetical protein EOM67_03030 [Spirochaetia bacterium]|nr:hypothetical protein [Spirochaetia bacterium]